MRKSNWLLAFLAGISFLFLSLPASAPVQRARACLTYLIDPAVYQGAAGMARLKKFPSDARDLIRADMDDRALREALKNEEPLKIRLDSLEEENARLRADMGLSAPSGRSFVWASVVWRDLADRYEGLAVSAGALEGLKPDDPVLAPENGSLVALGRILEVRPRLSTVQLLTDDISAINSRVVSRSTYSVSFFDGLAQGEGSFRLKLSYLPASAELAVGDRVVTAPASVSFPPSVPIGTVVAVDPPDPLLTLRSADVLPAFNLSEVSEVMILRNRSAPEGVQ